MRVLWRSWWIFSLFPPCNYYWQEEKAVAAPIPARRRQSAKRVLDSELRSALCWWCWFLSIRAHAVHVQCTVTILLNLGQVSDLTRLFTAATRWRALDALCVHLSICEDSKGVRLEGSCIILKSELQQTKSRKFYWKISVSRSLFLAVLKQSFSEGRRTLFQDFKQKATESILKFKWLFETHASFLISFLSAQNSHFYLY